MAMSQSSASIKVNNRIYLYEVKICIESYHTSLWRPRPLLLGRFCLLKVRDFRAQNWLWYLYQLSSCSNAWLWLLKPLNVLHGKWANLSRLIVGSQSIKGLRKKMCFFFLIFNDATQMAWADLLLLKVSINWVLDLRNHSWNIKSRPPLQLSNLIWYMLFSCLCSFSLYVYELWEPSETKDM